MIRLGPVLLLLPAFAIAAAPAAVHTAPAARTVSAAADGKPLRALAAWLKAYRSGKVDFLSKAPVRKSVAERYGVVPRGAGDNLTAERELGVLLEAVAGLDSQDAAELLLEVAAIGLDEARFDYEFRMAPHAVRALGEQWLRKLSADEALTYVRGVATGDERGDSAYGDGVQAAALRALAARQDASARETLAARLDAEATAVRLAAAEGLGLLGDGSCSEPLAAALDRENDDAVLIAAVRSLTRCFADYAEARQRAAEGAPPPAPPEALGLAVRAAIRALGRSSWRADMELVRFLSEFRSPETIPALIDVLQRFQDHPEQVESGELSGLLQHRVHETLVGMTGAVFPADRPDQWRELWQRAGAEMLVAEAPPAAGEARPQDGAGTVTRGFVGIPVEGTRVLFILDLSGSMNMPMGGHTVTRGGGGGQTKLDFAKKKLLEVLDGLPEITSINIITYNGNPDAEAWSKDLVTASSRNKERARRFVEDMRADGGTNIWAGMQEGLKMKSLVYGDRYESAVDEIFVLSDGAPTAGEVTDPLEILRLVTETNRFSGVRINTIFIASPDVRRGAPRMRGAPSPSLTPQELMRRMAEQNGGRFVEVQG